MRDQRDTNQNEEVAFLTRVEFNQAKDTLLTRESLSGVVWMNQYGKNMVLDDTDDYGTRTITVEQTLPHSNVIQDEFELEEWLNLVIVDLGSYEISVDRNHTNLKREHLEANYIQLLLRLKDIEEGSISPDMAMHGLVLQGY